MARGAIQVKIEGQYDDKDLNRAIRDLNRLKSESGAATGPLDSLTGAMKGLAAAAGAAFALGAVVDFMKDAATAAIQDEKSMVALATAMDNVGLAAQNASAEDFVKSLMLATGEADDNLRPALQRLITATGNLEQAQSLLTTAMDISAATGKDVVSVSQALAKASTGQVSALTRLGIPLDANIVKTKDFGAAVDVLNEKFGGQAAAAADTYGGQLKRVQTAAAEAQETIGYALLDAISAVSEALGGTGSAVGGITAMGDSMAGMVKTAGQMAADVAGLVAGLSELVSGTDAVSDSTEKADYTLSGWLQLIPVLGAYLGPWARSAADAALETDNLSESVKASESYWAGYIASLDGAAVKQRGVEIAAEDAAEAMNEMRQSFVRMTAALNASQSMDDFKKSLADLDTTLEGNKRSFKGMSDSAKENRDELRSAFSDAADIAQKWAEDNGKSADQAQAYYNGLARKIVNQFTKDGFKRSDVEAFLGTEGIWTGPAKDALDAAERAAMKKAYPGFKGVGKQAAEGFAAGFEGNAGIVTAAAAAVANQAERAAKGALDIQSPSRVFMEIGKQTVAGFVEGMASKDAEVREQARKSMLQSVGEVIADTRGQLKAALDDAKAAFADFQRGVSDAIMGGIDFGAAAPEFDEAGNRVGSSFLEGLRQQAAQAVNFATQVKTLIQQGLSQEALQQVLAAGVQAGSAIATELISGGTTAINETNALVASTQSAADKVGLLAAQKWYGAGVQAAKDTLTGFNDMMKPGGEGYDKLMNRMDRLAASMNRTARITVVVDEVAGAKVRVDGARAKGGPVWPGGAFIVGERGPELFMPQVSGQILPSASMPSGSGMSGSGASGAPVYNINVTTGVGDPRQIGQQVVEYIRKFEQTNGAAWRAA